MKRKTASGRRVPDKADVPSQPKEIPTHCPLFPTVRCSSVGKTVLQIIGYDESGEEIRQHIIHPRVTPEMDEADIAAIAGGGEYYVAVHKNDGSGQMISHRKLEIFGPPKEFGDDTDDDDGYGGGKGKPTVINVPDGEPIIVPANLRGAEQQAFIAQQQHMRSLQKQAEGNGGGGIAAVIGSMMQLQMKSSENTTQMMIAMMSGGGQNNAAVMALQQQLNSSMTERAQMIAQHGEALGALRNEHGKTMDALRAELAAANAEARRLTNLTELRVEEGKAAARRAADAELEKMKAHVTRLESQLLGTERELVKSANAAKAGSDAVRIAELAIPRVDALLTKVGTGASLPPELKEAAEGVRELRAALNNLPALMAGAMSAERPAPPPEAEPAPAPHPASPSASNGQRAAAVPAPLVPSVPDMPA